MAFFTFDAGTATVTFSVACALRMRVSMSAMGSLMLMGAPYQLALIIPGISPRMAISRILLRARLVLRIVGRLRVVDDRQKRLALLRVLLHRGFAFRLAVDDGKLGH